MPEYVISIYHDTRREKGGKLYPVKLRVYHDYATKFYPTGIDLTKEEFERSYGAERPRGEYKDLKAKLIGILARANSIAEELKAFDLEKFEKRLLRPTGSAVDVFYQYDRIIEELKAVDRYSTASNYDLSAKSLKAFLKHRGKKTSQLTFSDITVSFLESYERWMVESGRGRTTVGIYLRPLRAVFNKAIMEGEVPQELYPFSKRKYQIPQGRNIKKALSKDDLSKLFNYTTEDECIIKARDFFFFSYAVNGINIKDIAELRYKNITGSTLSFVRSKTKNTTRSNQKPIVAVLNSFAKGVISKYGNPKANGDTYVFPILSAEMGEEEKHRKVQAFTRFINQHVKRLAKLVGVDEGISTYYARHSFTTIAIHNGASMEFIQDSLGHQSKETTMNYWAGFADNVKKEVADKLMDF